MSENAFTPPENAAQRRQLKRYARTVEVRGLCWACKHRNTEETVWGRNICRIGSHRQHPTCDRDGKGVKFEFDDTRLQELADANR